MSTPLSTVRMKITKTKDWDALQEMAKLIAQAVAEISDEILVTLQEITGIQYQSLVTLAIMGHPYATRNPRPPQDPAFINRQSGEFNKSFYRTSPKLIGDKIVSDVLSSSRKAEMLLLGTPKMIMRPYMNKIHGRYEQELVERIVSKLSKFIKVKVL